MKDHHRMRAWDASRNDFLYLDFDLKDTFGLSPNWRYQGNPVAHRKDLTVELCTGLRDKNGVLIYEGDILSTVSSPIRKQKSRLIHRVLFANGGIWVILEKVLEWSGFKGGTPLESQLLASVVCNYEVAKIGNIHQNPKLLN